ncbi:MAG TPA: thioredoxin family protein [Candidatus Bathyarchaeia archaeon]|nr:thioredoxin family protein [Candidatus Bathyarchaeia archaeon]
MELPKVQPKVFTIGAAAPDFGNLLGIDGERYSLSSFQDKRLLVLLFISNGCPTVKACQDRMIKVQKDYEVKNVQLLALNSNNSYLSPADTYAEMVLRHQEKGFNFPYVKDEVRTVAKAYGAVCTPHVFLLDEERRLRYKGRIDDSRNPDTVTISDLRNAIEELLANRSVVVPETTPFGCSIVW